MAFETIVFEKQDGIATVTMNRPDRLNAMTWRMIEEFLDAVEDCAQDDAVRVLVFTGAGRAFSSGDDIVGGASAPGAAIQAESMPTAACTTN